MTRVVRVVVRVIVVVVILVFVVRLLPRSPWEVATRFRDTGAFGSDLPLEQVKVGTIVRPAIRVRSGSVVEVPLDRTRSLLVFGIAARKANGFAAGAHFVIEAEDHAGWRTVYDENLQDMRTLWHDRTLNLAVAAPNARRLRFQATETNPDPEAPAELYWSDVAVLQRRGRVTSLLRRAGSSPAARVPNVILISLDTLGARHLSAFGNARGVSPHIDELLRKSFSFTKAYAQYPNTLTSHASMFTGLLPRHHGVYGPSPHLRSETLTAILARHGYVTKAITEDGYVAAGFGFDRAFDSYDDGESNSVEEITGNAARTFPMATLLLDVFGPQTKFFFFVHTYEVHTPYEIRDYEARRTVNRLDPGYQGRFADGYPGGEIEMDHNGGKSLLTPAELKHLAALYAGEIHRLDEFVGRLVRHLDDSPFAARTLVILTADHGEEFGEHGKLGHGETVYEGALHVPLAVYWPGAIAPGTSDTPVQLVDVMPTVLDLVGIEAPAGLDGRSLVPLMSGTGPPASERPAYAEVRYVPFSRQRAENGDCLPFGLTATCEMNLRAARTERFKLIASKQIGFEAFFDLAQDPMEQHDASKQFPEELARHRALLDAYDAASGVAAGPTSEPTAEPSVDDETRERLKALGYIK